MKEYTEYDSAGHPHKVREREPVASPQATRPEPPMTQAEYEVEYDKLLKRYNETFPNRAAQPAAGTTPTRNSEVLADFVKYCEAHPAQRFWQALRNWSGYHYIRVSEAEWPDSSYSADTFDWEGRRHEK